MRKLITILLIIFCQISFGQVYQIMPQYGYSAPRFNTDSTLQLPTFNGVPTLKSNKTNKGAIAIDSTNGRFYFYNPKTSAWSQVSGGGGSTDTTSLSNRINLKIDSLKKSNDTIYTYKNGIRAFAYKDSIGVPIDTANKWVNNITRVPGRDSIIYYIGSNRFAIKDSVGTNPAPVGYYGAFYDTTTQSAAVINTAYPIKLNRTTLSNAVTIQNNGSGQPTRITINNTGIYNIQFSLQLEKTGGSGNMTADIWLRENGIDVPNSTGKVVLTGSANASPVIASWNYVINVVGGYYYELMWSASNVNIEIVASVASSPHPAIPSAILTVTQQSGIMAGTGITAINSLTGSTQTMVVDSSNSTFKITSTGTSHTFTIPNASTSGVTRGLISNTQYTTFNNKLSASDTASLSSRIDLKLSKVDTSTLSTRIDSKLAITDTSVFQRKSLASYTFQANNTTATANATAQTFRDSAQRTYSGTITWTGTGPTGSTNHSYHWSQIGKLVTLRINLVYATAGTATAVNISLPSDCPTPELPTGLSGADRILGFCTGFLVTSTNSNPTTAGATVANFKINSANNGYEFYLVRGSASIIAAYLTVSYFAQ